ncbi:MAG: glycosyltransferase, partial [bacterium]|nr:glycosyltransferase [bacterium]
RNEEHNIAECLERVKGWAAEIIVMDMESTDRTVEIARQYTDKVYSYPLVRDFDIARNESAKYATQPWVLYVDADERVPPAFADALREILPGIDESVAGVCVAIKNYFLGKWIRHAGKWYPAYNAPRLLRRGRFQWLPAAHQGVKVHGQVKYMPPDREEWAFEHFTTPSLNRYLGKLSRYSDSAAERMLREGSPCSWQTLAAAMGYAFRFYYDATEGYKDGAHGFLLALGSALSALVDQMKYAELLLREGRLQEEEFLPPNGEAFFQLVTDVAAGKVPVEQKYLSQILRVGDSPDAEPPAWWHRLWQRLQRQAGGVVYCSVDFPQTDGWRSWQEDEADALIVFGTEWKRHVGRLREGGSFFIGAPSFPEDALRWRAEMENAFGGTAHLIDPENECQWLFAFGWKGEKVSARRRVLMTTHQRALHMLGGGETQLLETLLALREQGTVADLSVSLRLPRECYDLIHAFSLYHMDKVEALEQTRQPLVVSTIFRDNSAFYPVAVGTAIFRHEKAQQVEELLQAWKEGRLQAQVDGPGVLDEPEPLKGVKKRIVQRANLLLPNCEWELGALRRYFRLGDKAAQVVPNAVRPERFLQAQPDAFVQRFGLRDFVLCAARIEPFKNQLMLLWALRDVDMPIVLAGKISDSEYGELCYRWANDRAHFVGELEPDLLASAYAAARVHAMPSWAETPGLTSLEAALAGCPIVVGNRGAEREYFGDFAYYCNPADVDSVREAVLQAWEDRDAAKREAFREYILMHYTWEHTARATAEAYERVLQRAKTYFCIPDWNEPHTWQSVVRRYLEEHGHGDGALLQVYAGGFNAFRAEDAFALLERYVRSLGVNAEECADIEIVDHLPDNFLGRVWLTGGRYDGVAVARYGGQCERAPDRAA